MRPEAEKRLKLLGKRLRPKGIELRPESYGWSVIQALLSRGDRRLALVIAAVRGRHESLGGWKAAYRELTSNGTVQPMEADPCPALQPGTGLCIKPGLRAPPFPGGTCRDP